MNLMDKIQESGLGPLISETELKIILQKLNANQRFSLVKREVASGKLIRIRRGLYCVHKIYRKKPLNLFEVAEKIYGPSYISFQSALSYHGLIPEAVFSTTSACSKRSRTFHTPLGIFSFQKIPSLSAFQGVIRINDSDGFYLIADPDKAILDYVYFHRVDWGMELLSKNLRIDREHINDISHDGLKKLAFSYKSQRINRFIQTFKKGGWE